MTEWQQWCQGDGSWLGPSHTCRPNQCPPLPFPSFPSACVGRVYGETCPVTCPSITESRGNPPHPNLKPLLLPCSISFTPSHLLISQLPFLSAPPASGIVVCLANGTWVGHYPQCDSVALCNREEVSKCNPNPSNIHFEYSSSLPTPSGRYLTQ